MNIGDAKTKTLQIINEFTRKGVLIPEGKNADYLSRMNSFINEAQIEVARVQRLETLYPMGQSTEAIGDFLRFHLPNDLWTLKELRLNGRIFLNFEKETDSTILVDNTINPEDSLDLVYYRYPTEITNDSSDSMELDVKMDGQSVIPYYVGAKVLSGETGVNGQVSNLLLNQFYDKLDILARKPKGRRRIIDSSTY